jgi:hypothetical protein
LAKTRMAKSVLDASWSMFRNMLEYKASRHRARYVEVDERWTTVCHERTDERRGGAVQEMEVGPPEPAVRGRLQTTASCCGQEPWW